MKSQQKNVDKHDDLVAWQKNPTLLQVAHFSGFEDHSLQNGDSNTN